MPVTYPPSLLRFGRNGQFAVILSPTDQGYYEPDTSSLLRLKLEQEYGYGNTPGTVLTDKVNLLGTGALPMWRWLEGSCRTPAGLGKIQVSGSRRRWVARAIVRCSLIRSAQIA
jgi:hypothetical protein